MAIHLPINRLPGQSAGGRVRPVRQRIDAVTGARVKIQFQSFICSAHQASRSIAGRISGTRLRHTAHRQQLQSSATAGASCSAFTIQFNAAALRKKWRNEAYPSSIDFWIVNSIFSPRDITCRGEYAAEIRDRRSGLPAPSLHAFFAGAGNFGVKDLVAAVNNCSACPGPIRSTRPIWLAALRKARCENGWSVVQDDKCGDTHS